MLLLRIAANEYIRRRILLVNFAGGSHRVPLLEDYTATITCSTTTGPSLSANPVNQQIHEFLRIRTDRHSHIRLHGLQSHGLQMVPLRHVALDRILAVRHSHSARELSVGLDVHAH